MTAVESLATGPAASPASLFELIVEESADTEAEPESEPLAVPLYTVFGAKGLQADIVFLANAITPAFVAGGEVADGVRRAYVAVTRSRIHLLISAPVHIQNSSIGYKVDAGLAGLASMIEVPARQLGVEIQRVSAA